jgi:hypothetical protein
MQVIINVPDNLPLATVEKFVQRIERRLIKKAAIVEFKKPRPLGLVKGLFEVPPKISRAEKIAQLKESQYDPLFLADLQAISDDFSAIDNEEW